MLRRARDYVQAFWSAALGIPIRQLELPPGYIPPSAALVPTGTLWLGPDDNELLEHTRRQMEEESVAAHNMVEVVCTTKGCTEAGKRKLIRLTFLGQGLYQAGSVVCGGCGRLADSKEAQ